MFLNTRSCLSKLRVPPSKLPANTFFINKLATKQLWKFCVPFPFSWNLPSIAKCQWKKIELDQNERVYISSTTPRPPGHLRQRLGHGPPTFPLVFSMSCRVSWKLSKANEENEIWTRFNVTSLCRRSIRKSVGCREATDSLSRAVLALGWCRKWKATNSWRFDPTSGISLPLYRKSFWRMKWSNRISCGQASLSPRTNC